MADIREVGIGAAILGLQLVGLGDKQIEFWNQGCKSRGYHE